MASTYSTNLGIELPGTGDQAGVWGNTTNTNLGTLIEQAISGYVTQAVATGTDTTITIPNGATGVARNMYIELTGTGGASTNLIVPANKKLYFIFNNTSSGQVTVKVSGQTGISVPNGKKMILVSNGTDIVTAENYVASLSSDNLSLTGSLSVGTTSAFTGVATFTANPVLNGGTANGVLYLNGSKVATSGSALVFDGTNLGLGRVTNANYRAVIRGLGTTSSTSSLVLERGDGAEVFMVNDAGNLGLGVTPSTWDSGRRVFQIGGNGALWGQSSGSGFLFLSNNLYYDGTNFRYLNTAASAYYTIASDASHRWYQAVSGTAGNVITVGDPNMILDPSGNLGVGTASPSSKLDVRGANSNNLSDLSTQIVGAIDTTAYAQNNGGGIGFGYVFNSGGSVIGRAAVIKAVKENATDGNYATSLVFANAANSSNTIEKMRLDSSGNLGLGVTPSAWGNTTALQLAKTSASNINGAIYQGAIGANNAGGITYNAAYNGTTWQYIFGSSHPASRYEQAQGTHAWHIAGASTGTISFTQAMTLDASGNLGIGATTTTGGRLVITQNNATQPAIYLPTDESTIQGPGTDTQIRMGANLTLQSSSQTTIAAKNASGVIVFQTGSTPTERGRFTAGGVFEVKSDGSTTTRIATKLTTVGTSATTITTVSTSYGQLVMATGTDSGGAAFSDLIFTSIGSGPTVISAKAPSGSPAARTYTMSGDNLQLAMGSGSYDVRCTQITSL